MFNLSNLKKIPRLAAGAPAAMKGFQELDKAALADGAISKKHKELIAIAVALTTQCGYCTGSAPKGRRGSGRHRAGIGRSHVRRRRSACRCRTHAWHPSHG